MKRMLFITLAATLFICVPARADMARAVAEVTAKTDGALAILDGLVESDLGKQRIVRQATCIDPSGIFIVYPIDPFIRADELKGFRLILPGADQSEVQAEFLGVDPGTNIGFFRAIGAHGWKAVRFEQASNLSAGNTVISAGLMPSNFTGVPCFGVGYVSSTVRVPGELVYITGGKLTFIGSPVFTADGRAVGLVGQQLFIDYESSTSQGQMVIPLRGSQETTFFMPVEEFVHALSSVPSSTEQRRLPWMGILGLEAVPEATAEILGLTGPGTMIREVVPDQVAEKSGLRNRDVIVALNGKPLERLGTPELSARNLSREINRKKPGDKITLTVVRDQKPLTVSLTLQPLPPQPQEAERYLARKLGVLLREKVMLDQYYDKSQSAKIPGLLVALVGRDSPAAVSGLRPNDLVTNMNDQPVETVATAQKIIEEALSATPPKTINLLVRRGDRIEAISIAPPSNPDETPQP